MVSQPRRWRAITTSLPSSPDPRRRTRTADGERGVPSCTISSLVALCVKSKVAVGPEAKDTPATCLAFSPMMPPNTDAVLPQAVVFDMDGTLLDTEPISVRAWIAAFAEH